MNAASLLRDHVGDSGVQTLLRKVVGRRVPRDEVEDVVQSVVCEALSSTRIRASKDELSRWLVGIAKHKVADHFRRRSTETLHDESRAAVPSAPFEARDLLRRVFGDAEADATLRRSMHLALREADGESYADLAESETSSEAALRQRVSRFRRAMASRWLGAAVLLVLLGAGVVGHRLSVREPIGPDLDRATLAAIDAYQGAWIVRAWSGAEPLVVGRRIDVARGVVTISTPSGAGDITLTVQRVKVLGADAEEWTLSSLAVGKIVAIVEMKDHRTTLTFNDDRFRGTAVLERP